MNHSFKFAPITIVILILFSCSKNITNDRYIQGTVIYRAEPSFPLGLIKLQDIHNSSQSDDSVYTPMESPSRGVIYKYNDSLPLDLFDTIYFKIDEKDDLQLGTDIKKDPTGLPILTDQEKYLLLKKIKFNLHNGDKHREGPKHNKIHPVGINGRPYYTVLDANPNIALLRYEIVETLELDSTYIRRSDIPQDTLIHYYIQFDVIIDDFRVHTLSLNHIH